MDLTGKVMLLTGCASGIAKHLAGELASRGARLLLTDVNHGALESHAETMAWDRTRVKTMPLDVRRPEQWEQAVQTAVDTWGALDVLMNVAGVTVAGGVDELGPDEVDRIIDINTKGTLYGCHVAARQMVKQGHGHLVNFASLAALVPTPGMSLYVASKFAVRGFSYAMAADLRRHGVYVTVVSTDSVDTSMLVHEASDPAAVLSFSGTVLSVEDVARVVLRKVLPKRPSEVIIPAKEAPLARLAAAYPALAIWLTPFLVKKGRKEQAKYRASLKDRA